MPIHKNEREKTHTDVPKIQATLRGNVVFVSSPPDVEELTSRGYGVLENALLNLAFYEALFLSDNGIIELVDEKTGVNVNFQCLLTSSQSVDQNAWVKYLIYRDLRRRGYVTRGGFGTGIDFRVYDRGAYGKEPAKFLILGIKEGRPSSVKELALTLRHAQSAKKTLVLAVMNRRGEIVYYSLSQLDLK